ncbi:MAG: hypothetical protein V4621_07840 [Pseudomonadota bacterium]
MNDAATITDKLMHPHGFVLLAIGNGTNDLSFVANMPTEIAMECMRSLLADYDAGQMPAKTYEEHPLQ